MAKNGKRVAKIKRHLETKKLKNALLPKAERRLASKMRRYERSPQGKVLGKDKDGKDIIGRRTPPKGAMS